MKKRKKATNRLRKPLADLVKYVTTDPRRYESRNPYLVPQIHKALKALGKDSK